MAAPKGNNFGAKRLKAGAYLHVRVRPADKGRWEKQARKEARAVGARDQRGALAQWIICTLNGAVARQTVGVLMATLSAD